MITILCSGSRGDIQPHIALAQAIQDLGQEVRIAAGRSYGDFVKGYGIGFYPLSADQNTVKVDPKLLEAAGNSTNPLKMLLTFNKMKKYARFMTDEMYEACTDSDVVTGRKMSISTATGSSGRGRSTPLPRHLPISCPQQDLPQESPASSCPSPTTSLHGPIVPTTWG